MAKKGEPSKNSNYMDKLKEIDEQLKAYDLALDAKSIEITLLLNSYDKSKDSVTEQALEELASLQIKREESNRNYLVTANIIFTQLKAQSGKQSDKLKKEACGLCGSTTKKLIETHCCKNWVCDDDQNIPLAYAETSCWRNHQNYTLCASHKNECHPGKWQDCKRCKKGCPLDLYAYFVTNKYNFEKLVNVPKVIIKCEACSFESYDLEDFPSSSLKSGENSYKWYCKNKNCQKAVMK